MIFSSIDGFLRFILLFFIFSSSFFIFCFLFSLFVPCGLFDLFLCCRIPPFYSFILYLCLPLLSLSFVSCFLFLFPVVILYFFNPFSLSILFHFFPLILFCFFILFYPLCSLLFPLSSLLSPFSSLLSALCSLLCALCSALCSAGLCFSLLCSALLCAGLPDSGLPGTTAFLVSGFVLWKQQEFIVNFPDGNGNQLFTIQSLILQLKEIVSEKKES